MILRPIGTNLTQRPGAIVAFLFASVLMIQGFKPRHPIAAIGVMILLLGWAAMFGLIGWSRL
jgi:hypothetical protein